MRFRLVVSDLDGTLLTSRHEISPRNLTALQQYAQRGAHICVATGRHPMSAIKLTSVFDVPYTMIAMNGAVILDQPSGDVCYQAYLKPEETLAILQAFDQLGLNERRDVFTLDTWYTSEVDDDARWWAEQSGLAASPIPESCAIAAAKVMIQTPRPRSREILAQAQKLLPGMHVVLSTPTLMEITAPGVSKGTAVKWLADRLGIAAHEIIAFGDQLNDVDMLEMAGYGVAMANAADDVKAVADRVTLRHDEDGVAHVLEEFLEFLPAS